MAEVLKSFTNTDAEDFDGMFHGEAYKVLAGESKMFTEKLAKHLAGQLAWKIAARNLDKYPQESIDKLALTFIGNVAVEPTPVVVVAKPKAVKAVEEEEFVEIKPKKAKKKK